MNTKGIEVEEIETIIAQPVHHQVKCLKHLDCEPMVVGEIYNYQVMGTYVTYWKARARYTMPIYLFAVAMQEGAIINVKDIKE